MSGAAAADAARGPHARPLEQRRQAAGASDRRRALRPRRAAGHRRRVFELPSTSPAQAVLALGGQGIGMSVTPYAQEYVRAGLGLAVTERDVDRALGVIRRLA